jgi:predicted ArsR family transcriptional regulator
VGIVPHHTVITATTVYSQIVARGTQDQSDLRYRALADPNRRHLLRLLDDKAEPMLVSELAAKLGLHINTVRGHLASLEEAGLVERTAANRRGPGRPSVLYRATNRDVRSPASEGYRFLAEVLASSIQATSAEPDRVAHDAGHAWGRYLVDRPLPFERVGRDRAVEQVVTTLAELGFSPEAAPDSSSVVIELHDCPFRDLARSRGNIVCSVHKGLIAGMLQELGGSVTIDALEPFVEPSLCVARLSETAAERQE